MIWASAVFRGWH